MVMGNKTLSLAFGLGYKDLEENNRDFKQSLMLSVLKKLLPESGDVYNEGWRARFAGFLYEQVAAQQGRLFYWCPISMAFGIGLYYLLPKEPPLLLCLIPIIISSAIFALVNSERSFLIRRVILLLLLLPSFGFTVAKVHTLRVHTPMIVKDVGPTTVIGTIEALEIVKRDYDARLVLSHLEVEDLEPHETPRTIRLRLRRDYDLKVGQRISVLAELMPLSGPVFPGGFDFRRHLYFEGIGAVGFIYKDVQIIEGVEGFSFNRFVEKARNAVTSKVNAVLKGKQASITTALMNGQRAGLDDEAEDSLRYAGLAHLLAISGLHLGLVCGSLFFFLRLGLAAIPYVALHYPIKKYCAVLALIGGVVYMFLAGATIPTQRALLMSSVVFLAIIFERSPFSLRLVAFAALIVLLIAPYSLVSASFQLSFAAVTALIVFYDAIRMRLSAFNRNAGKFRKIYLYFLGVCVTSLIAGLATAPFSLYHFQQFANYGLLANMVAIPIVAFWVMPLIVVTYIAMPLGLEEWPLLLVGMGVQNVLDVARYVSSLPGAVWRIPAFSFLPFLGMALGLLFFMLWRGHFRFIGLVLALLAVPFVFNEKQSDALVSSSNKLIAMRLDDGQLKVNSVRREKFVLENWERSWGLGSGHAHIWSKHWPEECDDQGCHTVIKGKKIAYAYGPYSHAQDCAWADLLIASDPVEGECAAKVIDKFDTYYKGAHAVWLDDEVKIKSVRYSDRRIRPWSEFQD